jgi:hypothetical protein
VTLVAAGAGAEQAPPSKAKNNAKGQANRDTCMKRDTRFS